MASASPTLHMICGRIAAGKSTLAAQLGREARTVVISEDAWLAALYVDEMTSIADYLRCTARLRGIVGPHVSSLLNAGVSVVLDFQANTVDARDWMRRILAETDAAHILHLLDVPEDVCRARLQARNAQGDHPFAVTEEQFPRISLISSRRRRTRGSRSCATGRTPVPEPNPAEHQTPRPSTSASKTTRRRRDRATSRCATIQTGKRTGAKSGTSPRVRHIPASASAASARSRTGAGKSHSLQASRTTVVGRLRSFPNSP